MSDKDVLVRIKAQVQVMKEFNSLLIEMDEGGDYYKLDQWIAAEGRIVSATLRVMGELAEDIENLVVGSRDEEKP